MTTHLSKKTLIILSFFLLIIASNVFHNNLIHSAIEEKLKTLHASGIFVDINRSEESFFSFSKSMSVRLDKVDLVADLLLGIRNNDPLMVHLSKLQGLKLTIEMDHTDFIFSNEIHMYVSLESLPEYFKNQSLLFSELLDFSKKNPKLIHLSFNLWDNTFLFNISELEHTFKAEQELSYHLNIHDLQLDGYVNNHSEFMLNSSLYQFDITLFEKEKERSKFSLNNPNISLLFQDDISSTTIHCDALTLTPNVDENSSIRLKKLFFVQNTTQNSTTDFSSQLRLGELTFGKDKNAIELENFRYDLNIQHLNSDIISHISELIHTSNTNSVAFIFDDLSDDILSLISDDMQIHINNFSFSNITLGGEKYYDAIVSLHAKSQHENIELPMDFKLKLHLSKAIYRYFLNTVPNASFTQNYLPHESAPADFTLELLKNGLMLNDKKLLFLHEGNTTIDSNQSNKVNFL